MHTNSAHALARTLGTVALFAAALCYLPALGGPLVLDDYSELVYLLDDQAQHWQMFLFSASGPLGRPLAMASFLANAATTGPSVTAVKATNLVLHLVCGALLWRAATSLAKLCYPESGSRPALVGAAVAALWLLHPLHVATVLYAVQRMTQLSALFCLAGLVAYVEGRAADRRGEDGRHWRAVALLVCWPLAIMSKENGLLFVVYLALLEWWIFSPLPSTQVARTTEQRMLLMLAIPVGLAALGAVLTAPESSQAFGTHGTTLIERVMTQTRVLMHYMALLLVPWPGFMGFVHDDVAASTHLLDPVTTLPSLLGVAACLALSIALRRRAPFATFGIAFFFAAHAMESTVLPLEFMFEHRCYLPSAGVFIALVDVMTGIGRRTRLPAVALLVCPVLLGVLLSLRVQAWRTEDALLADMLDIHPSSPRALALQATRLMQTGRYTDALAAIADLQGIGPAIQRERIRCRRGKADFSRVEAALADPAVALDQYAVAQVSALLRRDRHCLVDPAAFFDRVRVRFPALSSSAER